MIGADLLVVEDNEINQQVAQEILEAAGTNVTIANHGQEALDMLEKRSFDGILMDMQMPVMDGLSATIEIRAQDQYRNLPIIAMTANAMASDRDQCIAAGMNDYVAKPINVKELFETLGKWIAVPEHRRIAKNINSRVRTDEPLDSASTARTTPTLPKLPGIDTKTGLARVANNEKLYRSILLKLRKSQADSPQQIKKALADGDVVTAERLAHTLKGVAGNVGADALQNAAQGLEFSINDGKRDISAELELVQVELTTILVALVVLEEENAPSKVVADEQLNMEVLKPLLEQLRVLLEDDDSEASEQLDELRRQLVGSVWEEALRPLSYAIQDYDFETALTCFEELEQKLEHTCRI